MLFPNFPGRLDAIYLECPSLAIDNKLDATSLFLGQSQGFLNEKFFYRARGVPGELASSRERHFQVCSPRDQAMVEDVVIG